MATFKLSIDKDVQICTLLSDETKSTVNFAIWTFDQKPQKEIFLSEALPISTSELNNAKTFTFSKPFKLKKGTYLFAVGQSEIQGFVAFRGGWAKEGDSSKFSMKGPFEGYSDGKTWFDGLELLKAEGATEEELNKLKSAVTRMKIQYK